MTSQKHLQLDDIAGMAASFEQFKRQSNNYLYVHVRSEHVPQYATEPLRLDCLMVMLCRRGNLTAEINLETHTVKPGMVMVVQPGSLARISFAESARLDLSLLFVSTACLRDINIDINAINVRSLTEHRSPVLRLDDKEFMRMTRTLELMGMLADEDDCDEADPYTAGAARSLVAAIFYQLLHASLKRIGTDKADDHAPGRRANYLHEFMRLVHLNYMKHRTIAFYADKMCITAKYLTVVIKDLTGRSASDWINDFVIIEAKNLLRYSGKNVQQVAYDLNFTNQSAFGKYFKHQTGMSPTEFQKS